MHNFADSLLKLITKASQQCSQSLNDREMNVRLSQTLGGDIVQHSGRAKLCFDSTDAATVCSVLRHSYRHWSMRTAQITSKHIHNKLHKWLCYGRGTARRACQQKFCNYKTSHLKTRVPGLSCDIICVILRLAVFVQYRSVTDTHRQTDGRTDTRRRHVSCSAQRRAVKIDHSALPTKYNCQATSVG